MAMTVRLPADLTRRGRRYAGELGISLNALLAIALREYLDVRAPTATVPIVISARPSHCTSRASPARATKSGEIEQVP